MQEHRDFLSLELADEKSNNVKGMITGLSVGVLIVLVFLIPYFGFEKTVPLLEAEGVLADFGNVQYAGSNQTQPVPQPQPTPPQPLPEEKEDIEKIDRAENPAQPDVKRTSTTSPAPPEPVSPPVSPADGSLFPGAGKGDQTGLGDQGNQLGSFGKGDGHGLGTKGNGVSDMGPGRSRKQDCTLSKEYDGSDRGVVWVEILVLPSGEVSAAKWVSKASRNSERTTITDQNLRGLAERCALQYQYEQAPSTQKGYVKIEFKPKR